MIILGICESHEAHACVVRDGELLAVAAEERYSRLKTDSGYPRLAIDGVMRTAGISAEEIDVVVFASRADWIWHEIFKKSALYSVQDWIEECDILWKPLLIEKKPVSLLGTYEHIHKGKDYDIETDAYHPMLDAVRTEPEIEWTKRGAEMRERVIQEHLGLPADRIMTVRHEDCHQSYGYFATRTPRGKKLIFTVEGGGDDSSATVSIAEDGGIREVYTTNDFQLGRLYRYVTLLLGMKPNQHEYKIMGLAPYGTEYHGKRSLDFFRTINEVDGLEIVKTQTFPDLYFSSRDHLEGERFDGIAWALQTYVEEILCEWIANNCRHYGIGDVILSGGVSQNIKACKLIAELPEIEKLSVAPISGDGSLAVGAAWLTHSRLAPDLEIKGMPSVYLGSQYDVAAVDAAIRENDLASEFECLDNPSAEQVATWLDNGLVVARFSKRMEFGQRALGNRSILADPRRWESVERINSKIKYRDFWMPFTPSMMKEEADRLVENPKGLYSPFMTLAFDLKQDFRRDIPAAQHPSDKTVRPQMLKREDNPDYYDIIAAFKERTGMGVVLNTSFNLHGEPIVESPEDAISTFLRSDIDVLLFDHIAISRSDLSQ